MGLLSWIAAGLLAFFLTRWIEVRRRTWPVEATAALLTAALAGIIATALDFGGWAMRDGRAFAFCGLCSLLSIGMLRLQRRR